jgi:hypothetical protein
MPPLTGSAATALASGARIRGEQTPAETRSVLLARELAQARVDTITAMRGLQRCIMAGRDLASLADAAEAASLASGRLAGFGRLLAATLKRT